MNFRDPNTTFADLHTRFTNGTLSREDYDRKLKSMLVLEGKLPGKPPIPAGKTFAPAETSGHLTYAWAPNGVLSITLLETWTGHSTLNTFPRHVRQAARLELQDKMTELEAVKLRVARAAGDAFYDAVMDDLLCCRAEDIVQSQGPDTKRALNTDERFHLRDHPDLFHHDDLNALLAGKGASQADDKER